MADEKASASSAPLAAVPADADGPSSARLVCSACGAPLSAGDDYCAACGAELPEGRELRRRRRLLYAAAGASIVLAVAAAVTFGVLWRSEASEADDAQAALVGSNARAAKAEAKANRLTTDLADSRVRLLLIQRLAALRGDVVDDTNAAVKQVDPLLTSVDRLQQLTGRIQKDRNRFADVSVGVVDALIDLSNGLLEAQASGEELDEAVLERQIDAVNTRLDRLYDLYDRLEATDTAYGRASQRFEARANEFVVAVRRLQQQLLEVVEE